MSNEHLDLANSTSVTASPMSGHRPSRRKLLQMIAATSAMAGITPLLAACGGDVDDDPLSDPTSPADTTAGASESPETSGEADAEEPEATDGEARSGGELVIANEQSPVSLDPHFVRDVGSTRAMYYMYDSLIEVGLETELEPGLAAAWEISEDGLEYTFNLQENVTFQDDTPFDAEAVRFNLERHMDESVSTLFLDDFLQYVDGVEVIDEATVKLTLKEVYSLFAREIIAAQAGRMVSPAAVQEMGDEFAQRPVGTGPFIVEEFERDAHLVMVRNDNYWKGTPYLDSIRVRIIPEQGVQIVEQEAGNVHVGFSVQAKDVERLENAGIEVVAQPAVTGTFISMNLAKGVTQELAVRQAIARSVDRDAVISELLLGLGQPSRGGSPEGWPRYHDDVPIDEFNPEEAGRILDEAGWMMGDDGVRTREGERLTINVLSTQLERALSYGLMNQIIQQSLEEIGFETELQTMEWGAYLDEFRAGDFWEVTFHAQNQTAQELVGGTIDPDGFWSVNQHAKVEDPELAAVADQIREIYADMDETLDADARVMQWKEIQMLVQEHQLVSWLVHWDYLVGLNPAVRDLGIKPILQDTLHGIHLAWLDS